MALHDMVEGFMGNRKVLGLTALVQSVRPSLGMWDFILNYHLL